MNAINTIFPYKKQGTWMFNHEAVGLFEEPFVAGIPEIIEKMVADIPDAEEGFKLLFSDCQFPGSIGLTKVDRPDAGLGTWYYCLKTDSEGWLCPALFRYFKVAPDQLYAKAEPMELTD